MDRSRSQKYILAVAAFAFLLALPSGAFQANTGKQKAATKSTPAAGPKAGDVKVNPIDKQRYVWIPPGTIETGCSVGDKECFEDEYPRRKITLTNGFWLGETEVTQTAWAILVNYNPSIFQSPDRPVEMTTWEDADFFCSEIGGRLPTEAEWEYAARAGSTSARYGNINEIAWYWNNSDFKSHPVKQKKPNAWGLYDMLGNVVEWTHTWYTVQLNQETINPTGPSSAEYKSLRGGGFWDNPNLIRFSYRRRFETGDYDYNIGFRCVSP